MVLDGWQDEWMVGWVDGWMDGWQSRLRIAYSNQKSTVAIHKTYTYCFRFRGSRVQICTFSGIACLSIECNERYEVFSTLLFVPILRGQLMLRTFLNYVNYVPSFRIVKSIEQQFEVINCKILDFSKCFLISLIANSDFVDLVSVFYT